MVTQVPTGEMYTARVNEVIGRQTYRVFSDPESVREKLTVKLDTVARLENLNHTHQLMPYMAVWLLNDQQVTFPVAIHKTSFYEKGRGERLPDTSLRNTYGRTLYEFSLEGTSILFDGILNGKFSTEKSTTNPNHLLTLPIVGEPYGPSRLEEITFHPSFQQLDKGIKAIIDSDYSGLLGHLRQHGELSIVTLNPQDNILAIINDKYVFKGGLWVKPQ